MITGLVSSAVLSRPVLPEEYQKALRSYAAGVELFTDGACEPPETFDEAEPAASLISSLQVQRLARHSEIGSDMVDV